MGRPRKAPKKGARSDRRFLSDPRTKFKPDFIPIAKKLVRDKKSDLQIAEYFGVSLSTLSYWKVKEPKLARAMKRGEELLVAQTELSMWDRANGYSHAHEEISFYRGRAVRAKTTKIYPPDVGAAKMMLGAARPEKYRETVGLVGDAARPVKFVIENLHTKKEEEAAPSERNSPTPG